MHGSFRSVSDGERYVIIIVLAVLLVLRGNHDDIHKISTRLSLPRLGLERVHPVLL